MSAVTMFDSAVSLHDIAARHQNQIPVLCVSGNPDSKSGVFALLFPEDARVATLTAVLQDFLCTSKAVHVLLDGALPSKDTELRDLRVDGGVSLTYTTEDVFGGTVVVTPCGGGGSW